jgi:perosamine synthetase
MIPVNEPLLDGNEKKYLAECIDTGWISSEGPFVKKFEDQFSSTVDRKFGIAVANGSVALDAAVAALGIGKGDEVIMPTFTIISCAAAVVRAGAVPVLVDSDPITWNMDVNQIKTKITNKTKAIMVVHIYGLPVDMDPIIEIAEKYGLLIIEDAAEAHGLFYRSRGQRTEVGGQRTEVRGQRAEDRSQRADEMRSAVVNEFHRAGRAEGRPCGSFGDISTFSFYPNKLITTGEGGMIVTDNEELAERCRSLRNLCFQPQKRFVHEELGWNFRFTNLQAAVGLAQLEKLDEHIKRKRRMGKLYTELLSEIPELQLPLPITGYAENIYWVYGMVLKDQVSFDAEEAMHRLKEKGIGTRPFFWPMHEQPAFIKMGLFKNEKYPVAERIARRGFYIPCGLGLGKEQMKYVCRTIATLFPWVR